MNWCFEGSTRKTLRERRTKNQTDSETQTHEQKDDQSSMFKVQPKKYPLKPGIGMVPKRVALKEKKTAESF